MAKIVTVHGTFAHIETVSDPAEMAASPTRQWWQPGSEFETQIKRLVDSDGSSSAPASAVDFKPFVWNGDNSVTARRKAGSRLLTELRALEAHGEKYCILAHSHGGSVVSDALLESASRGIKLDGLQRWFTVGTPFIELRRERWLFTRLPLLLRAMFVASWMLFFMYLFYMSGELLGGDFNFANERRNQRMMISTVLTALPVIAFYVIAWYFDSRRLFFYRRRNLRRANAAFAARWLPLTHEDDEAVRGLASLDNIKFKIFHKDFAVRLLSWFSVFLLPLIYLWLVTSADLMVKIADYLKTDVYKVEYLKRDSRCPTAQEIRPLRNVRRQIRRIRKQPKEVGTDVERQRQLEDLRAKRKDLRARLHAKYPKTLMQCFRARRFERRFLRTKMEDGTRSPCSNGELKLCGQGKSVYINAKLLFHLVHDEVSSWVIEPGYGGGRWWWILRSVAVALLVPVVFGLAAIAFVLVVQYFGGMLGRWASRRLDNRTWFEIRRAALGNDTETEDTVGTLPSPPWAKAACPYLPPIVSHAISDHSNMAMAASITRIRAAISDFALSQASDGQFASTLNYLSWQELIHTSYFEVPEFRKLVACAIAQADGFAPSAAFRADAEFGQAKSWLDAVDQKSA